MRPDRFARLQRYLALSLPAQRAALTEARAQRNAAEIALQALRQQQHQAESGLNRLPMNTVPYQAARHFVQALRARCVQQRQTLTNAEANCLQACETLRQTHAEIQQWQQYRERQQQLWRTLQQKRAYQEHDEAWLRQQQRDT